MVKVIIIGSPEIRSLNIYFNGKESEVVTDKLIDVLTEKIALNVDPIDTVSTLIGFLSAVRKRLEEQRLRA